MGYFSWKTADTNKSISNFDSSRGARAVWLITPDGMAIHEDMYEGYGEFGGFDAYALLAKWNAPDLCKGDPNYDRSIGIDLFYGKDPVKYPLKFVDNPNYNYKDLPASETCPLQGFFYDDED